MAASRSSAVVTPPFTAAVLCGGSSRRMGRDKALLPVDGVAMARRVADAATTAGATEVLAVGGDAVALGALGLDVRPDTWPGDGPLPATLTALAEAREDLVLVVSCDLVAPSADTMARVVAALGGAPEALVALPRDDAGEDQWTHAAWRRSAARALAEAWEAGARSLRRGAGGLPRLTLAGLPAEALVDADSPEELPSGQRPGREEPG